MALFGAAALAADRARDPGRRPDRARLRDADRGVLRHAADAREVQRPLPLRDHARCSCSRGTFFPISNLPAFLQPIAWLSPLWHGVELSRGLALGTIADDAAPRPRPRRGPRRAHRGRARRAPSGRSSAGWCADDARPAARARAVDRPSLRLTPLFGSAAAGRGSSSSATSTSTATAGSCSCPGFFEPLFYLGSIGFGLGRARRHGARARAASRSRTSCSSRRPSSRPRR